MVVICILKDGTTVTIITHTAASGGLGLLQAGRPPGWRVRRAREAASGATCGRIRETQSRVRNCAPPRAGPGRGGNKYICGSHESAMFRSHDAFRVFAAILPGKTLIFPFNLLKSAADNYLWTHRIFEVSPKQDLAELLRATVCSAS